MQDRGKAPTARHALARDQPCVIDFLSRPEAYGSGVGKIERHDTHGAIVFLAGDDAYKIKRRVRFSYMDFSSLEKRRRVIEREFAINKPNAPEIYLGVVPITREGNVTLQIGGTGEPVEWALHMRRFNQTELLSAHAQRAELNNELCRALARVIFEVPMPRLLPRLARTVPNS